MNCFTHEGTAAIAVCGKCSKGICRSCAIDVGFSLVCSELCAVRARDSESLQAAFQRSGTKSKIPLAVVMFGLSGAIFLCFGLFNFVSAQRTAWFNIILGGAFIVFALLSYQRNRSFWRSASR